MKCILLCAGYSMDENLKLKETASSLVEINGKPLINYTIHELESIDEINEILVITNGVYYSKFIEWQSKYNFPKKIKVINDNTTSSEAKLGAIGDIRYAINSENINEDIMVLAGDIYFDFSLKHFVKKYHDNAASTIAGFVSLDQTDLSKYGVIEAQDGIVVGMQEKPQNPKGNIISLAAYIYPREVLRDFEYYLSEGNKTTYPGYFIEYLYSIKPVYVYEIVGNYYDVKSLHSIQILEQRLDAVV